MRKWDLWSFVEKQAQRVRAQRLCDTLNAHLRILATDGPPGEVTDVEAMFRHDSGLPQLLLALMDTVNDLAPRGWEVAVDEEGFRLAKDEGFEEG